MNETTGRGGFLGFMSTIPGILTASAGVITAVATYVSVQMSDAGGDDDPPQPVAIVTVAPEPAPAPPAPEEAEEVVVPEDLDLGAEDDPLADVLLACDEGDEFACADAQEGLAGECYDGLMASCDLLYWISPVDSDFEYYGATCGLRVDESYAGYCSES